MYPMLGNMLRMISGPLVDLQQKLLSADGLTVWLPALKRFLRKENPWDGRPLIPVVATVTIGQHASVDELLKTLHDEDICVLGDAEEIMRHPDFNLATEQRELDLCVIRVGEHLNLRDGAPYAVVHRYVEMNGLELCPPEAAVEFRRLWRDQEPKSDILDVAMKPIPLLDGRSFLDLWCHETGQLQIGASGMNDNIPGSLVEVLCVLPRS